MEISNAQKLILMMLCEIHKSLKIQSEIDPKFVANAILSDNTWGLEWQYTGLFNGKEGENPSEVTEVVGILDMWNCLEISYERLSVEEKKQVNDASERDIEFLGFDGNNEHRHLNVAEFLINDLERFQSFKSRAGLNSHCPMLDTYRRMLASYEKIRPLLHTGVMSASQIIEVKNASVHPDYAKKSA